MMKFFNKFKSNEPKQPTYRQYNSSELSIIAKKTRLVAQQIYNKQQRKIKQADNQFKKVQQNNAPIKDQYEVLQQIGKKVIQVESIKLYMELLRKIQAYSAHILNTKGDVSLMKQQLKWFQIILWFRKQKNSSNLQQIKQFCFNFFKGVDILKQIDIKSQIFKIYPHLIYIKDDEVIPLDVVVEKVIPHVSFEIDQKELDDMKKINLSDIRKKEEEEINRNKMENPFMNGPQNLNPKGIPMNQNNNPMYNNPMNPNPNYPQNASNFNNNNMNLPNPNFNPYNNPMPNQNPNNYPNNNQNIPSNNNQYNTQPNNFYNPQNPQNLPNKQPIYSGTNRPPLSPQEYKKMSKSVDDQFAIDPFSNIRPVKPNGPNGLGDNNANNNKSVQSQQNSFQSPNLDLIDWRKLYPNNGNINNPNEHNPYKDANNANSSKVNLLNNYDSEQSSYDSKTLPYPPSGVIAPPPYSPGKQPQSSLYQDLQQYQPQPMDKKYVPYTQPQNILTDDYTKIQQQQLLQKNNKNQDPSFLKNIQNQFFNDNKNNIALGGVEKRQLYSQSYENKRNTMDKPFYHSFNEQDLLKELQEKNKKQEPVVVQQKKTFNRLFGFKKKDTTVTPSNNIESQVPKQQTNNVFTPGYNTNPYEFNMQKKPSSKQDLENSSNNITAIQNKDNNNHQYEFSDQIDNMLNSLNEINTPTPVINKNQQPQSKENKKQINFNNNPYSQQTNQNDQIYELINSHKKNFGMRSIFKNDGNDNNDNEGKNKNGQQNYYQKQIKQTSDTTAYKNQYNQNQNNNENDMTYNYTTSLDNDRFEDDTTYIDLSNPDDLHSNEYHNNHGNNNNKTNFSTSDKLPQIQPQNRDIDNDRFYDDTTYIDLSNPDDLHSNEYNNNKNNKTNLNNSDKLPPIQPYNRDLLQSLVIIKKSLIGQSYDENEDLGQYEEYRKGGQQQYLDSNSNNNKENERLNNNEIQGMGKKWSNGSGENNTLNGQQQQRQQQSPTLNKKNSIKKPYMVSIYAREQWMNKIKNRINQNQQQY